MSKVDWVWLACVLASMLVGAWRGLVYEVLSLLGWLVAFVVARIWAADVALWLPMQDWDMQLRYAAGFVLLFVLALFGWGLVSWLSRRLIEAVGLRPGDRPAGAPFGGLRRAPPAPGATMVVRHTPADPGPRGA